MGKQVYTYGQLQHAIRLLKERNHTQKEISFITGVGLSRVQSLSRQYIKRDVNNREYTSKLRQPRPEDFIGSEDVYNQPINTHRQLPDGSVKRRLPDLSKLSAKQLIHILCNLKWRGDE